MNDEVLVQEYIPGSIGPPGREIRVGVSQRDGKIVGNLLNILARLRFMHHALLDWSI